jgi:hypothetical protein
MGSSSWLTSPSIEGGKSQGQGDGNSGFGHVIAVGIVHVNEVGCGASSLGSSSIIAVGAVPGKVSHLLAVEAGTWWGSGASLLVPGLVLGVDLH